MGFELKILLHSFKVESKVSSVAQFSLCTVDAPLLHSPDVLWRTPRQGNLSGLDLSHSTVDVLWRPPRQGSLSGQRSGQFLYCPETAQVGPSDPTWCLGVVKADVRVLSLQRQ